MIYSDLITEKNIQLGLDTFDSESTLAALADGLVECSPELKGRRDEVFDALREREERGSTGQQGVAIPHVQLSGLSKTAIVIGVNSAGVGFRALDGEVVKVFFAVVRPEGGKDDHLQVLRWIAGIAKHQDFVSFASQAEQPSQVVDLLSELSPA